MTSLCDIWVLGHYKNAPVNKFHAEITNSRYKEGLQANIFGMMADKNRGSSESDNRLSDLSDEGMSELSADESDPSDLDLVIRRRRATKRDMAVALSPLKDDSKRYRKHGSESCV